MKRSKLSIWWVDDEPGRVKNLAIGRIEERASDLAGAEAKVEPIILKTQKDRLAFEGRLVPPRRARATLPSLIVLDQNLNEVATEGLKLQGSSLAVSIRAAAPLIPVVGVTAVGIPKIPELQREQFIELFSLDDLQSGARVPDLYAIIDGFAALSTGRNRRSVGGDQSARVRLIRRWFGCPAEDNDLLSSCLPGDFLGAWDTETPHVFARWVWHTLLGRPGFLYDDLEIATLLGLTQSGLTMLLPKLGGCGYDGIFASVARRRWWLSRVRHAVRDAAGASASEPLWKLGRELLGAERAADFSRCHGRPESDCVPDVVAFEDDLLRDRVQALSEDTKLLETDTPPPGFEKRLVFTGR
jgi:hypothetical protein